MPSCLPYNPTKTVVNPQGLAQLPAAVGCISIWNALDEYFYDWAQGHVVRDGPPNKAIFELFEPDAPIGLGFGG